MHKQSTQATERVYSFDWLRIIACAIVILIHCIHMFGELYQAKASLNLSTGGAYAVSFATYWCMDLFFLVAGASTWLALRKKTARQFIHERFKRLLWPLVIGFILLVPFQAYFEQISNGTYRGTLGDFYPFLLGSILFQGKISWIFANVHHLWFLSYLFVFSLIALPLCLYLRGPQGRAWIEHLARFSEQPGGILLPILPVLVIQLALRGLFPAYCSIADALCWLCFYIDGYILFASPRLSHNLQQQGKQAWAMALSGLLFFIFLDRVGLLHTYMYTPDYSFGCLLFQSVVCFTLWACLLITLNLGHTYLNKNAPFLKYGSTTSFWWYMLHFPIVILIAYGILPLHLSAPITYSIMVVCAFTITFICADLWQRAHAALTQYINQNRVLLVHWFEHQRINSMRASTLERVSTGSLS